MASSFPFRGPHRLAALLLALAAASTAHAADLDEECKQALTRDDPAGWEACVVRRLGSLNADVERVAVQVEQSIAVVPAVADQLLASLDLLAVRLEQVQIAFEAMQAHVSAGNLDSARTALATTLANIELVSGQLGELERLIEDRKPWFPPDVSHWEVRDATGENSAVLEHSTSGEPPPESAAIPLPPAVAAAPTAPSWKGELGSAASPPGDLARLAPLLEARCPGLVHAELSGPWEHEGARYFVGVVSRSSEPWSGEYDIQAPERSCLLLARAEGADLVVLGNGPVDAGYSLRRREFYPPMSVSPLFVPGWPACARVLVDAMGHGGGGEQLEVHCPSGGDELQRVLTTTLESYTETNASVERALQCRPIDLIPDRQDDEVWLMARGCFDGEPTEMLWRFEGESFTRAK